MKHIDWSNAPEWATKHGIVGAYRENQIWFNDTQYTYCDGQQDGRTILFTGGCAYKPNEIYAITVRPETPQWNGEGLPPVGVTCKIPDDMSAGNPFLEKFEGKTAHIIAHTENATGTPLAVFWYEKPDGSRRFHAFAGDNGNFEPIRAPEQIAAEEREAAIKKMCGLSSLRTRDGVRVVMEELYDAGLRFPEVEQGK